MVNNKILVRNATMNDIDEVMCVEHKAWPPDLRASRDKLESRLRTFPQGFYVAFMNNKMVGVSTSEIIRYDGRNHPVSWNQMTDDGWIVRTHDSSGNALYVVSIGASVKGKGVGSRLLAAQKSLVIELSLDCLVLGARCPEYYKPEFDKVSIEEYVRLRRRDDKLRDCELRFYEKNWLRVVRPVSDYLGMDWQSRNYGVIMTWNWSGISCYF